MHDIYMMYTDVKRVVFYKSGFETKAKKLDEAMYRNSSLSHVTYSMRGVVITNKQKKRKDSCT